MTQTFASGDRVLNLLAEEPVVSPVENGTSFGFENLNVTDLAFVYVALKPVRIGCNILLCVWVFHIMYFIFGVKTLKE